MGRCALSAPSNATLSVRLCGNASRSTRSGRHHRTEHLLSKPHVAGYRAAALAHSFDFAFFDIIACSQRYIGQNVGAAKHTLAAEAGDDNVGDGGHGVEEVGGSPDGGARRDA